MNCKKLLSLLLVLCLAFAALPVKTNAVEHEYVAQRLAGSNRFETSILVADALKVQLGTERFHNMIIASGMNFADALSGSYLGVVKEAPILLCWSGDPKYDYLNDDILDYVKDNLMPDGTVYILGGTNAVPQSVEDGLKGVDVKRLAGKDRFETNLLILEEAGVCEDREILVCTGSNFADSLSASALGQPILLVFNEYGDLYGRQAEYLGTLNGNGICIIGGESAVSAEMADILKDYSPYKITRVEGKNRFETSKLVAEKGYFCPDSVVLAYGWNYPDGLCGGVLAYFSQAPLILAMDGYETWASGYVQDRRIDEAVVLGGTGLISDEAVDRIFTSIRPPVRELKLSDTNIVVTVGQSWDLSYVYRDNKKLTWYSDKPDIAEVSNGRVVGKTEGITAITLSDGSIDAICYVRVIEENPEIGVLSIKTPDMTVVYIGDRLKIDYSYTGDKSALRFESDDPSVLTVDDMGIVTGIAIGNTVVHMYHGDTWLGYASFQVEENLDIRDEAKAEYIRSSSFTGPYFDGVVGVAGNFMTFITAAVTMYKDTRPVIVTSSNPNVASVTQSDNGNNRSRVTVSFKGAGTTTITITSEDGCASYSYNLTVKGSYDNARDGKLTPEEFAACANGIMVENGATINTTIGWRMLALTDEELTGSRARSLAESWVREQWPNGIRAMAMAYQGMNEDGKHVFYFHR